MSKSSGDKITSAWANTLSKMYWKDASTQVLLDASRTSTLSWTDLDLTNATSADAKFAILQIDFTAEVIGTGAYSLVGVRKNGTTPDHSPVLYLYKNDITANEPYYTQFIVGVDSNQIMEYQIYVGTGWTVTTAINVLGYVE